MQFSMAFVALSVALTPLPITGQGGFGAGRTMRPGGTAVDFTSLPTRTQLEGPPAPGTLTQMLQLDSAQAAEYAKRWQAYMDTTRAVRDSARTSRTSLETAMQGRDGQKVASSAKLLGNLWKDLRKEDERFVDKRLEPLLTKTQRADYARYEKQWKRQADDEKRTQQGGPNRGGRRPGGGGGGSQQG